MPSTYRRNRSRPARWTAVLAVALVAAMMAVGPAAWADEPAQDDTTQQQPPSASDPGTPAPGGSDSNPSDPGTGGSDSGTSDPGASGSGGSDPDTGGSGGSDPGTSDETPPSSTPTDAPLTSTDADAEIPEVQPLPVTVSPRAGGPGTTVELTADLRGCTRPGSAQGFFLDRSGDGVDGASRRLVREHVTGGRWYSAQYLVTHQDAVGQGQFGVVCDFNLPTATQGHATFRVQPSRAPVPVRVTPQAAGRGTTVKITADVGRCERLHIWFYDSKSDGLTEAGGAKPITPQRVTPAGRFTASYTLTRRDAIGPARFSVVCGLDTDNARVGQASFRVLAANGQRPGGDDQTANRHDNTQLPNRIDTGQGGTADGAGQDGLSLSPMVLLPAAGLLLISLAAGLWLRQTNARRRL